ncbi:MAG: hypothetical protein CBC01_08270 [Betaproteobacteria bacterium TMED41]|nr:MAG: hypothetical protein CBC01_08270 [Betaproteobacteria bacterium TMED41]
MAYKINNTFGTLLVTLPDGTIDTAATDLTLFGKAYAGFGEKLNENFVKILENFNNTSSPANKIQGQLWFDQTNKQINVYTGAKWKPVGSTTNSSTSPTNAVQGDLWFDTANTQLYVYTGSVWTLIGPTTIAGSGVTQVVTDTVLDNAGVYRSILKLVTQDTVVAVVSNLAFTPSTTEANAVALTAAGFSSVAQGVQLSSTVASAKFRGTSTDSDALGGIAVANFLRSDQNDSTTGHLEILNDNGLRIGAGSDIQMTMTGDNFTIANVTSNGNIAFTVNDGGVTTTALTMEGSTANVTIAKDLRVSGNLTIDGDTVTNNTSTLTVEDNIIELNRNVSSNAGMPNYTGLKVNRGETSVATEQNLYWVWDETFADDGTTTHGNAGGAWTAFKSGGGQNELSAPTLVDVRANIVHATSTSAQYADLAERYESDCETEVGDVVMLGGHAEVTKCNKELCDQVFGVVSESPAFLMNASAGNNDTHPMIALKGRVLVKLTGKGNAGERIVSAGNGEARVANIDECTTFNTIGRLIKHKYNEETTLTECVIGVK